MFCHIYFYRTDGSFKPCCPKQQEVKLITFSIKDHQILTLENNNYIKKNNDFNQFKKFSLYTIKDLFKFKEEICKVKYST